jgi:hypothetical protein
MAYSSAVKSRSVFFIIWNHQISKVISVHRCMLITVTTKKRNLLFAYCYEFPDFVGTEYLLSCPKNSPIVDPKPSFLTRHKSANLLQYSS